MSRITLIIALLLPLAVVACEERKPMSEQKPAASAPLTDEEVDQTMIPVKADFEEEALTAITVRKTRAFKPTGEQRAALLAACRRFQGLERLELPFEG